MSLHRSLLCDIFFNKGQGQKNIKNKRRIIMSLKTSQHTNIHNAHPEPLANLYVVTSKEQPIKIVPKPTKRYMKKLELEYLFCPDCESQDITFYGKTSVGAQKHRCKECGYQFVTQFDAIFPQSKRRSIFEEEFLGNIKPTGFDKVGTGKKKYWSGSRLEVLQMLESQVIKVRFNKMIKTMPIRGDRDYRVLLEFIMGEAYSHVAG